MRVQKRNGDYEDVSFDKILKRIKSLCTGPEFSKKLMIDPTIIAQKVCSEIYDEVKTTKLDELSSRSAISMYSKDPEYGKLSHRTIDSMLEWANEDLTENKDHPLDFALWKGAKPGEPSWDSPWGAGRPGWHIECTAMAIRYLGNTIDIHGGGQDLIFPHHENEIAQSEGYTGEKPFVATWMHNGLLHLGNDKMSKSLGNLVTVKEALSTHSSDALRLLFLSSHYRSPLTYSESLVQSSDRARQRLVNALKPRF